MVVSEDFFPQPEAPTFTKALRPERERGQYLCGQMMQAKRAGLCLCRWMTELCSGRITGARKKMIPQNDFATCVWSGTTGSQAAQSQMAFSKKHLRPLRSIGSVCFFFSGFHGFLFHHHAVEPAGSRLMLCKHEHLQHHEIFHVFVIVSEHVAF